MTNSKKSYRTLLLSLFTATKTVAAVTFSAFKTQIIFLNPVVITPAAEKQKGLSSDRPYIFVFYRNMKVKKGRRLVRCSVMLKRTAAMVPRVIKAGLACNWCCAGPTVFHRPGPRTSGVRGA